jgi:hypothetical protein
MLEVMRFIFSSFWVWLGTLLLVSAAGGSVRRIMKSARKS